LVGLMTGQLILITILLVVYFTSRPAFEDNPR